MERMLEQQARWLLANIDFYREDGRAWWETPFRAVGRRSAGRALGSCRVGVCRNGSAVPQRGQANVATAFQCKKRSYAAAKNRGACRRSKIRKIAVRSRRRSLRTSKNEKTLPSCTDAVFAHQVVSTRVLADALIWSGSMSRAAEWRVPGLIKRYILMRLTALGAQKELSANTGTPLAAIKTNQWP